MREGTSDLKNVKCFWNAFVSRNKQLRLWINEPEGGGKMGDEGTRERHKGTLFLSSSMTCLSLNCANILPGDYCSLE